MVRRRRGIATSFLLLALLAPGASIAASYEEGDAAFQKKDYATAMRHWLPLAEAGHAGAQLGVARLYYSGLGVVLDYEIAAQWCAKAAEQGQPNAQYILGAMYRDGKGVEQDSSKAMSLSHKAATQGVPGAQYNLGLMYMKDGAVPADYAEAYYWLGLAATASGKEHSQLRSTAAYMRDDVGSKLSSEQLAELRRRIDERKSAQAR
jgi:TPR repeat protein